MIDRARAAAPHLRYALLFTAALLLGACDAAPAVRFHSSDTYPERLSEWGLLVRRGDRLTLGDGVQPYEVRTALFSDYALKLRTLYLPPGESLRYHAEDSFDAPVGSIVTKTFFYPVQDGVARAAPGWDGEVATLDLEAHQLVETRLLVRQPDGWDALPYVWDGEDAYLRLTGAVQRMQVAVSGTIEQIPYVVPARSECASCHATDHTRGTLDLIGVKARHLNRPYATGERNQLTRWQQQGRLTAMPALGDVPHLPAWDDPAAPLEARARAYLDSNCGHCHNASGSADTSGLLLDAHTTSVRQLGYCKSPIAAGRGTGGRPYSIVPGEPDQSILVYRMETSDPATRMPEIGRALSHREGVALIREWIASLPGECV